MQNVNGDTPCWPSYFRVRQKWWYNKTTTKRKLLLSEREYVRPSLSHTLSPFLSSGNHVELFKPTWFPIGGEKILTASYMLFYSLWGSCASYMVAWSPPSHKRRASMYLKDCFSFSFAMEREIMCLRHCAHGFPLHKRRWS